MVRSPFPDPRTCFEVQLAGASSQWSKARFAVNASTQSFRSVARAFTPLIQRRCRRLRLPILQFEDPEFAQRVFHCNHVLVEFPAWACTLENNYPKLGRGQETTHRVFTLRRRQTDVLCMHLQQHKQLLGIGMANQVKNGSANLFRDSGFDFDCYAAGDGAIDESASVRQAAIVTRRASREPSKYFPAALSKTRLPYTSWDDV